MNNIVFKLVVLATFAMIFPPMANAQLFGRRGCSTGHCFTPAVHHAAPVVEQRDILQNFFIGLSPTPLDSPRGTTVYARDLASEVQLASDLDYLNIGKQYLSASTDVVATARSIRPGLEAIASKNAEANLTLAKGEAAANVLRSFGGDTSGTARTVVMTLRNGKLEQFQELQATPAELPPEPAPQPRGARTTCIACHSPNGEGAAKFKIDGPLTPEQFSKGKAAIESGSMPPKAGLNQAEKDRAILGLGRLVEE